jgi:hypothetical protein
MTKKSIVVRILGGLITFLGFITSLMLAGAYLLTVLKQTSFTSFLSDSGIAKDDCLGLFLPPVALYCISLLFSISLLVSGLGVIFFKEWGRKILLVLIGIELIWLLGDLNFTKKTFGLHHGIEILIMLGLLFYFNRRQIKEQFKQV